jgi:glycosyltransferase involved in cell wall biosynthesis
MKIVHLIEGPIHHSAYRAVYGFHLELLRLQIGSAILTRSDNNIDNAVFSVNKTLADKVISRACSYLDLALLFRSDAPHPFNLGFFGFDFTKTAVYRHADILHLHWVNGGFVNMRHLSGINKPIVWTMRDMWPMTGGCHYPIRCEKYKKGCGSCMMLKGSNTIDLSSFVLARKKKYLPKSIKLIGISPWMTEEALKSNIFQGFDVQTIKNSIDCNEFFPLDKELSKKILKIDTAKKIILTGASSLSSSYKGFDKYLQALKKIDPAKYYLCFFGNVDNSLINTIGFEYRSFGYLHDAVSLRLLYSASDVFVASSIMEAFGKTIVESMACGTPVVCFDATGPKSIVTHKVNGYKARPYDPDDLATGIEWITSHDNYDELSTNAIYEAQNYDNKKAAEKYAELYRSLLSADL